MRTTSPLVTAVASLLLTASGVAAAAVNKCVVNGTVTYQREPCPSGQVRRPPTIQELNAEEKRRRESAAAAAQGKLAPAAAAGPERPVPAPPGNNSESRAPAANSTGIKPDGFSCDGRKYCSQMKSCAEAKYFLSNCPGVKMDGDKNGIPCEQQWCGR